MSDGKPFRFNGKVKVFMYESELNFLKWLVLQKPNIETGGDLFGLWQDERTAVVQLISGPGEECKRTTISFYQDVDYLKEVGGHLTSSYGLCNIGQWHSHHTLSLTEPSAGDKKTVWNHLPSVSGGRFIVFIANIKGTPPTVSIGCFLFSSNEQKYLEGDIKGLRCSSPIRDSVDLTHVRTKSEFGQDWITFSTTGFALDGGKGHKNVDNREWCDTQALPSSPSTASTLYDENIDNGKYSDTTALLNNGPEENKLTLRDKIRNMFVWLKNVLRRICCCSCCRSCCPCCRGGCSRCPNGRCSSCCPCCRCSSCCSCCRCSSCSVED